MTFLSELTKTSPYTQSPEQDNNTVEISTRYAAPFRGDGGMVPLSLSSFDRTDLIANDCERVRLMKHAAHYSNDVIMICSTESLDPPGPRVIYVNEAFTRITGYAAEEIIGKSPRMLQGADTSAETRANIRTRLSRWEPITCDIVNYKKDGTPFWCEMNIHPIPDGSGGYSHFMALQRDVTQRKWQEKEQESAMNALQENKERLIDAQRAARTGSWEYNIATGKINWSPEMFRILQFDPALGEPDYSRLMSRYHPDDVPMHNAVVAKAMADGIPYEFDIRAVMDDGTVHWMYALGRPMRDHRNTIVGLNGTVQDITDRKESELNLTLALQAAEAATQAKSAFLANMSHELRTPLNGILGINEVMLQTNLTEEQENFAQIIQSSGQTLLLLLNDILDLSKIEAGKLEMESSPFDLRRLVSETLQIFCLRAQEKGISLKFSLPPDISLHFRGDGNRLQQVLTNLIANAIKFTERGEVKITVGHDWATPTGVCRVRVAITDTGIGIDPASQKRLFQNFTQADNSMTRRYGGTGLGLAISKHLIELMGGEIGMASLPGKGSTFWFQVPLETVESGLSALPSESPPAACNSRVLLGVNNSTNRIVIKRLLEKRGCRVETVSQGSDVLRLWREQVFDLALLDMDEPEMAGDAAVSELRAEEAVNGLHPDQGPFLIIGLVDANAETSKQWVRRIGTDDTLTLPLQPAALNAILQKWLSRHRATGDKETARPDLIREPTVRVEGGLPPERVPSGSSALRRMGAAQFAPQSTSL
ncbi:MAG: PAS domain S-box protein [Akkermansiaceae bacterium]|nr:PAS domain S-box protein [Armatimonadota bacterium]